MSCFKKGTAAILAGVLSVSSVVPAFAADPADAENYDHVTTAGNVGNAAVTLTVEDKEQPVIFSAYVPAELPIAIDVNGDVVVPEDAKIVNGVENLPIEVEDINATMEDGWTLASMDDDLSAEAKDTKKVAMELNGQDMAAGDKALPWKIEADCDLKLGMQAKLPDQSASSKTNIATIGFTMNWWEDKNVSELNATHLVSASKMRSALQKLTGSIVFSTEGYDSEKHPGTVTDISEAGNGSIMAVVNGQDAVVYSEDGTLAPENSTELFYKYQAVSMDLRGLDTSQVTNMRDMFRDSAATNLDISSFDTSQVTNMSEMFYNSAATSLDLSSFDTSQVTTMSHMFRDSAATSLNLSSFDTSQVTSMGYMFNGSAATSLDLSSFDTSQVTDMGNMFQNSAMTSIDLSSFDTSQVTSMHAMFYGLSIANLDLSSFNTSQVKNMFGMFQNSAITSMDLSSFDMSQVEDTSQMFALSNISSVLCRSKSDATIMKDTYNCPSSINFIVKS